MSKIKSPILRWLLIAAGVVIALGLLIQLVPYGHGLTNNPPVKEQPKWDSEQTKALAKRACFDCHSNEAEFPFYAYVAPVSWLLQSDVTKGRNALNFSDWANYDLSADAIVRAVNIGKMPPFKYIIMHPQARFSDAEKQQFINGIQATIPK